jgi:hypothetical protein
MEARFAQTEEATKLRQELRVEMKSVIQQFIESFHLPLEAKTPESNKRPNSTTNEHDSPPSEKRRDDCTTPVKLFTQDMDLRDSEIETDAMVADA